MREPLEDWVFRTSSPRQPEKREQQMLRKDLAQLDAWLKNPPEGKRRFVPEVRGGWYSDARLEPGELPWAEDLYRRLTTVGGTGKTHVEEALLSLIACALDPSTIPFFVETLDVARPRDNFATRRRELSLAALALLAYQRDEAAAVAALLQATHHPHPQVRALAVFYLGRIYLGVDEFILIPPGAEPPSEPDDDALELRRPVPDEVGLRLTEMALGDPAFEPRFQARAFLREIDQPVPLDNPEGTYALKVKFMWDKRTYRTIEVRSDQTLDDLQRAIQRSIRWDNDHLYSFFMDGQREDNRYRFSCPLEDDSPPWTDETAIGELGLTLKHKFLYLFDYGDNHEFEIEVVGIHPRAEPGTYPRVIDSQGKAPAQYRYADEDEWDDEDLEDNDDLEVDHE